MNAKWFCSALAVAIFAAAALAQPLNIDLMPIQVIQTPADPDNPARMSDYIRMSVKDGKLVAQVIRPAGERGQVNVPSVHIPGLDGMVDISRGPGSFNMSVQQDQGNVSVSVDANTISINREWMEGNNYTTVTFQQPIASGTVTLRVQPQNMMGGIGGGRRPAAPSYTGTSFGDFCIKHPDETQKYLVPMFQAAGIDGVLHVSREEAVHLFAAMLAADPSLQSQFDDVLKALADDSPDVRMRAVNDLNTLGEQAVPLLKNMDISKLPLQTRITLRSFMKQYNLKQANGEDDPRLKDADYLKLCLALDDAHIPEVAKKQLETVTGKPVDFDVKAPLAERTAAVMKLRFAPKP